MTNGKNNYFFDKKPYIIIFENNSFVFDNIASNFPKLQYSAFGLIPRIQVQVIPKDFFGFLKSFISAKKTVSTPFCLIAGNSEISMIITSAIVITFSTARSPGQSSEGPQVDLWEGNHQTRTTKKRKKRKKKSNHQTRTTKKRKKKKKEKQPSNAYN